MWKKCKHVYKARLDTLNTYANIANFQAKLYDRRRTELVKICVQCGKVRVKTYRRKLLDNDFADTPIGKMLDRYKEYIDDSNGNDSRENG